MVRAPAKRSAYMTVLDRVNEARRTLRRALVVAAVLEALAGALGVVLAFGVVDALFGIPPIGRMLASPLALLAAVALGFRRLTQSGVRKDVESVALWIESRFPALNYALVTAVDPLYAGRVPEIERQASRVEFEPGVSRAARSAVALPGAIAAVCAALLLVLPTGALGRITRPGDSDPLGGGALGSRSNALATIVVTIVPPTYASLATQSLDNPASVRALIGSALTIEGRAGDDAVAATIGTTASNTQKSSSRWTVSVVMPSSPVAVRLHSGLHDRLLVLEPVVDSAPVVTLTLPVRDSIYRTPSGAVRLSAELSDDLGLASGAFEYIVSSGGGENFTFKSGTLGGASLNGRRGTIGARFLLDTMRLQGGDILHIRAIARDRNTVSGAGMGASETRTLRIARADEYDSVAVDAAPPPEPEKNVLSQRMLLMMAEALEKKRLSTARAAVVTESRQIAVDQTRLRKLVGEIVFQRLGENEGEEGDALEKRLDKPVNPDSVLAAAARATNSNADKPLEGEGDETPIVAINKPLLEAYNQMWSASTELELGEPGKAIPFMRKALEALQRARSAERVYLRGKVRTVVVDVERVRLAGKDKGAPSERLPRVALDPARVARLTRFDAALTLTRRDASASVDSLLVLRLDLLDRDAVAARALDDAANALRGGRDATSALIRARRALSGGIERRDALSLWGAGW
jgi:hypothetical protein